MICQKLDTSSTSWVNATKFSVNYDANNNIDNFYLEFWNKSSSAWLGDTASYKSKYNFRYASYSSSIASVNNNSALLQVYPNPANEELKIKISGSKLQNATVILYDMMGKVLNRQEIILPQFQELSMNTANLASGAYIISLVTAQDKLTQLVQIK